MTPHAHVSDGRPSYLLLYEHITTSGARYSIVPLAAVLLAQSAWQHHRVLCIMNTETSISIANVLAADLTSSWSPALHAAQHKVAVRTGTVRASGDAANAQMPLPS